MSKKVNARDLVGRLGAASAELLRREILAPLVLGGRIRTRVGGLVYELRSVAPFAGWGHFIALDERSAESVGDALPWERAAYLELFPALRVVLLWPDPSPKRPGTWLALPFNESDARQRFRLTSAEPLLVHLGDPALGADRYERVIARVDGRTLWFDGPDPQADPEAAEWLRTAAAQPESVARLRPGLAGSQRQALLYTRLRNLDLANEAERRRELREARRSRRESRGLIGGLGARQTLEDRLRHALGKADAELHSFQELMGRDGTTESIVVEWSERGQRYRYRSTLQPDLAVLSSGICLSDRDRDFDLTSLVSVFRDSDY
ncbi:MAG: hypothetical protein HY329_24225 [Chloroflexi bacterium]|nr:hypothetical protein [Chloroflexota bacterium]